MSSSPKPIPTPHSPSCSPVSLTHLHPSTASPYIPLEIPYVSFTVFSSILLRTHPQRLTTAPLHQALITHALPPFSSPQRGLLLFALPPVIYEIVLRCKQVWWQLSDGIKLRFYHIHAKWNMLRWRWPTVTVGNGLDSHPHPSCLPLSLATPRNDCLAFSLSLSLSLSMTIPRPDSNSTSKYI